MKEQLGRRLKECRLMNKVYQRFEKGIYECSYEQLNMLCDIFDVSADYLLGRENY